MQRRKTCTIVIQLDQEEGRTNVAFFNPFVGAWEQFGVNARRLRADNNRDS